jgi:hypothetical protein
MTAEEETATRAWLALNAAEQRMERAKAAWTTAAQSALRHDEDAVERVAEALRELEGAHDDLRRLIFVNDNSLHPGEAGPRPAPFSINQHN